MEAHSIININAGLAESFPESRHTIRAYTRWIVNYFDKHITATYDLSMMDLSVLWTILEKKRVKTWIGQLKEQGLGKQSLIQARSALVWLAEYIYDQEPEQNNETDKQNDGQSFGEVFVGLKLIKVLEAEGNIRLGIWLTNDEIKKLLGAPKTIRQHNPALALRDRAMLLLLFLSGIRRQELVDSYWSDCIRVGGNAVLNIRHGKGKKPRQVKLPPETVEALEKWHTRQKSAGITPFIFTQIRKDGLIKTEPITPQTVLNRLRILAEIVGLIPDDAEHKLSPHDARRSFARGAFEAGASYELIRQSLGHQNITTTEIYVKAALKLDHAAPDDFAAALRNRKRVLESPTAKERDLTTVPELLTRQQAADYLGITIFQFDTLKKRAKIDAVRSAGEQVATNAKTRPFSMYRREDVDTLSSEADRLHKKDTKI